MTGSWLIVKWVGITITAFYLLLILIVFVRFRAKLSQLRTGMSLPLVIGNFVGFVLPGIFEEVVFTRICFIVTQVIYMCGIAVLVKGLSQEGQKGLFKEGSAEDYIQPLKLS
jgi:hypothetical protein